MDDWIKVLNVPEGAREHFLTMATLEHAPAEIRAEWMRQEAEIAYLIQKVEDLETQMKVAKLKPKPMARAADKRSRYES